jgi:hypothetical protein
MVPPCGTLSAISRMSTVVSVMSQLSSFIGVRDRSARRFASVDEDVQTRPKPRFANLESERQRTR